MQFWMAEDVLNGQGMAQAKICFEIFFDEYGSAERRNVFEVWIARRTREASTFATSEASTFATSDENGNRVEPIGKLLVEFNPTGG